MLDTTDDPHPIFASPPSQAADAAAGRRLGSYVDGLPVAQRHWLVLVSPGDPRPPALLETGSGRWLVGGLCLVLLLSVVEPITKYAVTIERPEDIRRELERAVFLARDGRAGSRDARAHAR